MEKLIFGLVIALVVFLWNRFKARMSNQTKPIRPPTNWNLPLEEFKQEQKRTLVLPKKSLIPPEDWQEERPYSPVNRADTEQPDTRSILPTVVKNEKSMTKTGVSAKKLRQGIVMKEILDPPRSKRPYHYYTYR